LLRVSSFAEIGDDFDEEMDFDGTGTHPNSTFVTVSGVPEDLTTVTIFGQHAGGWINKREFKVGLSSEPPMIPSSVPNHQNFLASPIQNITYGLAPASTVLSTKFAIPGDVILTNPNGCPAPGHPTHPLASVFSPPSQMVQVQADGQYLLHYFAQDCAGTEELLFSSVGNGGWATSFFTVPVNVDTVAPTMTGPTLSPAPIDHGNAKYAVGTQVTASFSCGDDASGVATCGLTTYNAPGTLNTGALTVILDTSKPGSKSYTFSVTDFAGNAGPSVTIKYNVVPAAALK
jgi:hypothetical protein